MSEDDDCFFGDDEYENERASMSLREREIELFIWFAEFTEGETKH